jgi:hypothetical protein
MFRDGRKTTEKWFVKFCNDLVSEMQLGLCPSFKKNCVHRCRPWCGLRALSACVRRHRRQRRTHTRDGRSSRIFSCKLRRTPINQRVLGHDSCLPTCWTMQWALARLASGVVASGLQHTMQCTRPVDTWQVTTALTSDSDGVKFSAPTLAAEFFFHQNGNF